MENEEKPHKKKIFSIFCCFSTNEERRRRKRNGNQESLPTLPSNKTNITEQNINININEFLNEEKKQKLNKPFEEKIKINSNINEDTKSISKEDKKIEENKKSESNYYNRNNNIDNYFSLRGKVKEDKNIFNKENLNKTIEQNIDIMKFSFIKNDIKDYNIYKNGNNNKLNSSEINTNEKFKNNILLNKEKKIIKKNKISDKEDIISLESIEDIKIKPIPIKKYQSNIIEENKDNDYIHFSICERNDNKFNLYSKSNTNIYDNNERNFPNIKLKKNNIPIKKEKNNDNIKLNTLFKQNKIQSNKIKKNKPNLKINTDSMSIIINKNSNLSLNNSLTNSIISSPISKYKINISTLNNKKKNNIKNILNMTLINRNPKKNNSCNFSIRNIVNSFPYILKKIKHSQSVKLKNRIQIKNEGLLIPKLNKSKNYAFKKFNENKIKGNLNYKTINNIYNKTENIIEINKQKLVTFSPQNNYKQSRINIKKGKNKLPLTTIGEKLKKTNDKTFIMNDSKSKDISNNIKTNIYQEKGKNKINNNSHFQEKSNLNNTNSNYNNNFFIEIKNESNEKIYKKEEDLKESEVDIEEDDISEKKIINDSKSIISNYISSPIMNIQDIISYAPSLFSKTDNISNMNDILNNKGRIGIPLGINEEEIEIMAENGKDFKSFIDTPRGSGIYSKRLIHKNMIYNSLNKINNNKNNNKKISNSLFSQQMKYIYDKIIYNNQEIKKLNEKIVELDKNIKTYQEYNKKYELWIEKEESESEILINMLNFLNNNYNM